MPSPTLWIYHTNPTDTARYTLGEKGDRMIACIGINPSTARPGKLDRTLQSVKRITSHNGYDGWLMINVYPKRATDPKDLPKRINKEAHQTNTQAIRESIIEFDIKTIWVAYGDLINSRKYLINCLTDIYLNLKDLDLEWKIIQDLTKKGHPRHPLYKSSKSQLLDFDFEEYAKKNFS